MSEPEQKQKFSITKKEKVTLIVCLSILVALIIGVVLTDALLPNKSVNISTSSDSISEVIS